MSRSINARVAAVVVPAVVLQATIAAVAIVVSRGDSHSDRFVLISVSVAACVSLLVTVIAGVVVARSIVRPLRQVGSVMRRFGDGDLHIRAHADSDDVGTLARSFNVLADGVAARLRTLQDDADRGTQMRVIAEALELAPTEADVHRISERALGILVPDVPSEFLYADGADHQMHRRARNPVAGAPNCPVVESGTCVAIRFGQTVVFNDPDDLNACPHLRDRPTGPCSATCIPINAGSGVMGVLHATGPVGNPPSASVTQPLVTLSRQAGTRMGSMRTLASSMLEASTDTLTGLANRRFLESSLSDLLRTSTPFVLIVADLDHFKDLNDSYGHEVGDRALQLFSGVLQENVRGRDIVARFGGEEFVLVYPEMEIARSIEVVERMRGALELAVTSSQLPRFTCSYGVAHSSVADDVDAIIRVADAGLMRAKELGRDRVVYADAELAAEVFPTVVLDLTEPTAEVDLGEPGEVDHAVEVDVESVEVDPADQ